MHKDDVGRRFVPSASFPTTQWTVVLEAGALARRQTNIEERERQIAKSRGSLECLCARYRPPLLAYLTARPDTRADAEDLVQGFLVHITQPERICQVDGKHGKFRTWLLASLNHYVSDQARPRRAKKRGGDEPTESLDTVTGETAPGRGVVDRGDSPDRAYDRQWTQTVLDNAWSRLREEFTRQGKQRWLELFEPILYADRKAARYRAIAGEIGLSESGARSAVDRTRKALRELIRDEIARTLPPPVRPEEVEAELRYLLRLVGGDGK